MARVYVQPRHRKAAQLYLYGSASVRGNWDEAAKSAGFDRTPSLSSAAMQKALTEAEAAGESLSRDALQNVAVDNVTTDLSKRLEQLFAADADWPELAKVAKELLAQVATGRVEAKPGQVSSLKEIIGRAEGRIGQQTGTDRPIGIVVLPSLTKQPGLPMLQYDPDDPDEEN